ncbi:response regulator transcription factor [Streptococcus henryi]|uniref:response regulator transcription factor n=1 Tax=Streptococcus henryi TaxID=439219 RepID=UPI000373F573|nr:response regulator transcription factor [Streptococcus henryi]
MIKLLVVEDDRVIQKLISTRLKQDGYSVLLASDGQEALDLLSSTQVDLVITDLMMPHLDGLGLIKALRAANYNLPILIVSAKGQLEDLEDGFELGADDYMVKPLVLKELSLRVKALLRRAQINADHQIRIGSLVLDEESYSLINGKSLLTFPKKEFQVLYHLLGQPNKIFTRLDLLDAIWGMEEDYDERLIDACIKKIRQKIAAYPLIQVQTVRGVGYKAIINEDSND